MADEKKAVPPVLFRKAFLTALVGVGCFAVGAGYYLHCRDSGKRILETQEKYFVADLGIRNAILGYRDNDIAGMLENIVFMELLARGYTVNIGKQGAAEVDFVAQKRDERLYIQVT